MNGFLYASERVYDETALAALLHQLPADAWLYLEHETKLYGDYAVYLTQRQRAEMPERYNTGRLFTRTFELRWQRYAADQIDLQWLTESEKAAPPSGIFKQPIKFAVEPETSFLLWGTHHADLSGRTGFSPEEDVWIETRIPRPLAYPVAQAKHVRLKAYQYTPLGYPENMQTPEAMPVSQTMRWTALEGNDKR